MKNIKETFDEINSLKVSETERSQKTQKYIKSFINFGYFETEKIIQDLNDEIYELNEEIKNNDKNRILEELGDVIFVLCNLGLKYDIKLDEALKYSTDEYQRRWKFIEEKLGYDNVSKADKKTLIYLWKEAKKLKK